MLTLLLFFFIIYTITYNSFCGRDYHFIAQLCTENSHILLMLFYLVVDQTATSTHISGCYKRFFFVLKTHLVCFNIQVNNLDDMERNHLFFVDIKQCFGKIKSLVISRREIYEPELLFSKYLKKHYVNIQSKLYNFMYADEMKIKIEDITNIFL